MRVVLIHLFHRNYLLLLFASSNYSPKIFTVKRDDKDLTLKSKTNEGTFKDDVAELSRLSTILSLPFVISIQFLATRYVKYDHTSSHSLSLSFFFSSWNLIYFFPL